MKQALIVIGFLLFYSCKQKTESAKTTELPTQKTTGQIMADMKTFYLVLLKPGPNANGDTTTVQHTLKEHLAYSTKMYNEGRVQIFGPLMEEASVSGIVIYNTATLEEAKKFANEDPAIKGGVFVAEVHPWGSFKGAMLK